MIFKNRPNRRCLSCKWFNPYKVQCDNHESINYGDCSPRYEICENWAPAITATGEKHDTGKSPLGLIDRTAIEGLARILEYGAGKYSTNNWRGGLSYSRVYDAALRHLMAFIDGEDNDKESGLPHVDHAFCCLMFLSNFVHTRPDLDDRFKQEAKQCQEK